MTSAGKLRPSQRFLLGWEEKLLFQGVWLILQKNTLGLQATLYGYMEEVHWQQEGKQPSDRTVAKDRAEKGQW